MKSIKTTDLIDLQIWCREFSYKTKYPADEMRRFAIGFYQIYQGIEWKDTASSCESYAAAAIHFLMVSEMLELDVETYLPRDLGDSAYGTTDGVFKCLLYKLSKAQSYLVYMTNEKNIVNRKGRYDPSKLCSCLSSCISHCFGLIRPADRAKAVELATQIMTGVL